MGIELNVAGVHREPAEDFLQQVGEWLRSGASDARVDWPITSAPFRQPVEISGDRLLALLDRKSVV